MHVNTVKFGGIIVVEGRNLTEVSREAEKLQKSRICLPVVSKQNDVYQRIYLTDHDVLAFLREQGVQLTNPVQAQLDWRRPVESLKASFQATMKAASAQLRSEGAKVKALLRDYPAFTQKVQDYVARHPEQDITGNPVIRKTLP